ncbi:MAG: prepilin peptidase [Syntrophothermus sp.]|uniref:prepilin peptidase n=1 Tax=Syntrophothermus sp. TaxID=2736299 RepID=UPI0025809F25|nr:A24 family peptidase [Syntrophothermus sp.]NSW83607.1 prepilin peptidase [Syntrophothermus sp.]
MEYLFNTALIYCAFTDIKERMIYNSITIPLALAGMGYNIYLGTWKQSLTGFAAAFLLGYIAFAAGGMGGGDVKLGAAIGAWLGIIPFLNIVFLACLVGIPWGLLLLARYGKIKEKLRGWYLALASFHFGLVPGIKSFSALEKLPEEETPRYAVPFGACLVAGCFIYQAGLFRVF